MKPVLILIFLTACTAVSFAQTTTTAHSGYYAAQVTRTSGSGDSGLDKDLTAYRIPVTPGNNVVLKFWARNGQVNPSTIQRASLVFYDSAGTYLNPPADVNFEVNTSVPTGWTQYTAPAQTVPATAAKMNVAFRLNAGSVIVIDDVSVIDTTVGPTAELAVNGGFEDWPGADTDQPANWRFFAVAGATGEIRRLGVISAADPMWSSMK